MYGIRSVEPSIVPSRATSEDLRRYRLVASSLARRDVMIAPAGPEERAWTDGDVVHVPVSGRIGPAVAVQAALLGAGSLAPGVVRRLTGRPAVARRYLVLEAVRLADAGRFPPGYRIDVPAEVLPSGGSEHSLERALGREPLPEPPVGLGAIRPRRLLARGADAAEGGAPTPQDLRRGPRDDGLPELDEEEEHQDLGRLAEKFSSPVGGQGPLARMLRRVLGLGRQEGTGAAGAELPTGRGRITTSRGRHAVVSSLTFDADPEHPEVVPGRATYPEWNTHRNRYRPEWCTVHEVEPPVARAQPLPPPADTRVRRVLARLGIGVERQRRRPQGEDLDLDALVDAAVERLTATGPVAQEVDEDVYVESVRSRRDLAVLVLLDVSGSGAEAATRGSSVYEQQRVVAAKLVDALARLGDRVALYAFHSRGRAAVHVVRVKSFDDRYGADTLRRLAALEPSAYTRLGAAIRHGTAVLGTDAGTEQRLLVVVSDGFAYDDGYEGTYAEADARRALAEARRDGVGCICLSVGTSDEESALRRVFGTAAHARADRFEELRDHLGGMFRDAIRVAQRRRRRRGGRDRAARLAIGEGAGRR